MPIRPFKDPSDRSTIINIMNQMDRYFNPEKPDSIDEDRLNLMLTHFDSTIPSRDFLIAEDRQGTQIGFVGFLKASKKSWWDVSLGVIPNYITTELPGKLLDTILDLAKEQSTPELRFYPHASFSAFHEKFQNFGTKPVQYYWMLRLDDFKKLPEHISSPDITIRKQKGVEDYPGYAAAFNDAFRNDFNFSPLSEKLVRQYDQIIKKAGHKNERIFALDGNKIVGFVISRISNDPEQHDKGIINNLGVIPSYQRRGIGSALLSFGIQWLRNNGCKIIELGISADNENALELYKKFGFYELESQKFLTYSINK